ncbi:GNAT family N-acetyltransferase [Paenibacillus alvei]|uniref:GNAT family N-acetyltransferase n=1 Tax=Paenibacillus alvei TaxID=44250 RepID=UPI003D2AB506
MIRTIRLEQYRPELAEAIAEMWNDSNESFGGGNSRMTAQQVRQQEENTDTLALYLALDGERVVGYCKICEYREDTGALYVQLLNVHPDYHGQKIGKLLVTKAVEDTIELGWPRLDLYTWQSNTKAVPLYKKCGFFWEDRDETTHLMNFIPTVVRTEALAPYFEQLDWYEDSIREINVTPDGIKQNGFDYYAYEWGKSGKRLRVEFERRGRGMRLIETDDYLLAAEVDSSALICGRTYSIRYRLVNKTQKPLHIELRGVSDRNIHFDWHSAVDVIGDVCLIAEFDVQELQEELSEWKTSPAVCTELLINGKAAQFRVGVLPKLPAKVEMKLPNDGGYHRKQGIAYIDFESHLSDRATFRFFLPSQELIVWEQSELEISLEPLARQSIAIHYNVLEFGYYQADIQIYAESESGDSLTFMQRFGAAFPGVGAAYQGKNNLGWHIGNGKYAVSMNKEHHDSELRCIGMEEQLFMSYPKLGTPFSDEFSKKAPAEVEFIQEANGAMLKAVHFRSSAFPHVLLKVMTRLHGDGIVERWFEATNEGDKPMSNELWVSQSIRKDLFRAIIPYEGQYVEMSDSIGSDYEYWDSNRITERWLFNRGHGLPIGICWSEAYQLNFQSWHFDLNTSFGAIDARATVKSDTIIVSLGSFTDWRAFRALAMQTGWDEPLHLVPQTQLMIGDRNPFVKGEPTLILQDRKQSTWNGNVEMSYRYSADIEAQSTITPEEEATQVSITLRPLLQSIDVVDVSTSLDTELGQYQAAIFRQLTEPIECVETLESNYKVFAADNGVIRIKAAPDYYTSLFSLEVEGEEWLMNNYPSRDVKSWWNPFVGGIYSDLNQLTSMSVLKQERSAQFVKLSDQHHNEWQGIRVDLNIQEHEKYKGICLSNYYLLLPGVPILCHFTDVLQNSRAFLSDRLEQQFFVHQGEAMQDSWVESYAHCGRTIAFPQGKGVIDIFENSDCRFGSNDRTALLHIISDHTAARSNVYVNKEVSLASITHDLNIPNGQTLRTSPVMLLFSMERIEPEALTDLRAIRFSQSD